MSSVAAEVTPEGLEEYRRELTGFCYRMLGSSFEADDAVQETMLRAWQAANSFEGRSSVRSWIYKIASNICIDMLRGRQRRALPVDFGPSSAPSESLLGAPSAEETWLTPIADSRVLPDHGDPAEIAALRESVRLAFVAAMQHLPARQRAALILCEVLKMPAAEAADALGTSVASVNSALQRARATLASSAPAAEAPGPDRGSGSGPGSGSGSVDEGLLRRYVDAFQRYDMSALVKLLHDDAEMQMPPFSLWLRGSSDIVHFMQEPGPSHCAGAVLVPVGPVNGVQAWGQYNPSPAGGYTPWALQVHEATDGKISRMTFFLDAERLFPEFGLAPSLP
jgi:RNA polymerase sigma-70 factor, ECF subfamily